MIPGIIVSREGNQFWQEGTLKTRSSKVGKQGQERNQTGFAETQSPLITSITPDIMDVNILIS